MSVKCFEEGCLFLISTMAPYRLGWRRPELALPGEWLRLGTAKFWELSFENLCPGPLQRWSWTLSGQELPPRCPFY